MKIIFLLLFFGYAYAEGKGVKGKKPTVPDTMENLKKCICGGCPTHNQCMKDRMQGLFCARGKTDCESTKNGCICGSCPIASEYRLDKGYYCEIGAS